MRKAGYLLIAGRYYVFGPTVRLTWWPHFPWSLQVELLGVKGKSA